MDEEAFERSVQDTLLFDPCNLNVLPPPFEIAQFTKSNLMPAMGIGLWAVSLNISLFTQLTLGSNAEADVKLASIAFPITYVEYGAKSVEIAVGLLISVAEKKQVGDSMASKIPSLSSSISSTSTITSLSVSKQTFTPWAVANS